MRRISVLGEKGWGGLPLLGGWGKKLRKIRKLRKLEE